VPEPLLSQAVICPYCGEPLELLIDTSAGEQRYIEDCQICCRPIECRVIATASGWQLEATRDDD
jgi:hypothetical protein